MANAKGTQVQGKPKSSNKCGAFPLLHNLVPTNVPSPEATRSVLHPGKDVFVLKVAKVGPNGDRRCKMELELVTPKGPGEKGVPFRCDTRDSQCDPEPTPCACCARAKKQKKVKKYRL